MKGNKIIQDMHIRDITAPLNNLSSFDPENIYIYITVCCLLQSIYSFVFTLQLDQKVKFQESVKQHLFNTLTYCVG